MPSLAGDVIAPEMFAQARQPRISVDDGLVLRPWVLDDAPAVYEAFCDPAIRQWHVRSAESVDEVRHWIATWIQTWDEGNSINWAVADIDTGEMVGRASLKNIHLAGGQAELAYWTAPAARGRSIATRAAAALTRWAFDEVGFHRLELTHSVRNPSSCRVAVKAGFALEGTMRSSGLHMDGWHDMHLHARINDE